MDKLRKDYEELQREYDKLVGSVNAMNDLVNAYDEDRLGVYDAELAYQLVDELTVIGK